MPIIELPDPLDIMAPEPDDEEWESVRLLRTAMVHVTLRPPPNPPMRRVIEPADASALSDVEFRYDYTRRVSTWLGQPLRCRSKPCQRARACQGHPPDCWREEPPITWGEWEITNPVWQEGIKERLAAAGLNDE